MNVWRVDAALDGVFGVRNRDPIAHFSRKLAHYLPLKGPTAFAAVSCGVMESRPRLMIVPGPWHGSYPTETESF